jgi:hypothetical protein
MRTSEDPGGEDRDAGGRGVASSVVRGTDTLAGDPGDHATTRHT